MMKILIIFIILTSSIFAKIERVTINPKNRVNIYFNSLMNYKSELSNDKRYVNLAINDSEFTDRYSQVSGSGIVKYVSLLKKDNQIITKIELSSPRGYTAIPLPFSQSICIEAFSWDGIDKTEDTYREALLAYEIGNTEQAKELLKQISEKDLANAKAILGIILLKEGQIVEASKYLFEANRDSSNIEDVYAGLAEIFKFKGNEVEYQKNDSLFRRLTKLESFPSFQYVGYPEEIVIPEYYYSNIEISENKEGLDTTISDENNSGTYLQEYEDQSIGEILGFSDGYIIFVIIIVVLSALMLFYVYNKWKQSKIKEFKDMSSNMFQEEVRQARKRQKDKIEQQQKVIEDLGIKKPVENDKSIFDKKYGKDLNKNRMDNIQQFRVKPTKNVKEITNKEQLEKFLTNYIPLKRIEESEKKETKIEEDNVYDAETSSKVETNSPDVNLALRLAEEKNRIKQKQLLDLAKKKQESEDSSNTEEIDEDTKSTVKNKLGQNEDQVSKLKNKFNVDDSKK